MSSYQATFTAPSSIGSIVVGIAAALTVPALPSVSATIHSPYVRLHGQEATHSTFKFVEAIDKHHGDSDVYSAITAFYGAFSSSQKPLEAEFSKVLFDNLWDLYAT